MNPKELPDIDSFKHRVPVQLRFNDVDILGHVNNTVYFSFYDTGKALYFRDVRKKSFKWTDVDTVIANVNCAYIASILFGDEIEVLTKCTAIHDKSFVLQQVLREKNTGEIKSICETVMVSFDIRQKHSTPVSEQWRKAIADFENDPQLLNVK